MSIDSKHAHNNTFLIQWKYAQGNTSTVNTLLCAHQKRFYFAFTVWRTKLIPIKCHLTKSWMFFFPNKCKHLKSILKIILYNYPLGLSYTIIFQMSSANHRTQLCRLPLGLFTMEEKRNKLVSQLAFLFIYGTCFPIKWWFLFTWTQDDFILEMFYAILYCAYTVNMTVNVFLYGSFIKEVLDGSVFPSIHTSQDPELFSLRFLL